jgi:outer membrane protein assembly factor BamB
VIAGDTLVAALQPQGIVAYRLSNSAEVWRAELAADWPLSADDELVYVTSRDVIHALRLSTGEEVWRTKTGQLTAPPLFDGGWVVAATVGSLAALRATDGAQVWRRELSTVEYAPVIDGDLLIVPLMDEALLALQLKTGETKWETPLGGRPAAPLASGGKLYVSASDKRFYALDADTGRIDWPRRVGAGPRGRAAADDDHVYFVALDNVLRALDRGNGALRWQTGLPYRPGPSGPVLIGSALIVPGDVTSVPVFARDGTTLPPVSLSSTLVGISNAVPGAFDYPVVAVITGDLEHPWVLTLLETSTEPPPIPILPLTVMPGVAIPIVPSE